MVIAAREVNIVVDVGVVRIVLSQRLHVLSQPPGTTSVSHKPFAKIVWHSDSSKEFDLPLQRSVVVVVVVTVDVVVVNVVEVLVLVLVGAEEHEVHVVKQRDVVGVLVVVTHPLHALSH